VIEVEAIEAATRRALVAEEHQIDGWWLRSNPDLPNRRPNSATTPPRGRIDPAVVGEVVDWFVARDAPPIIRLLSVSDAALEAHLDENGWSTEAPTRVMVSDDLARHRSANTLLVDGADGLPEAFVDLREAVGMTATAARLVHDNGRGANAGYAIAPSSGATVGVGRAEMGDAMVGLYDVVTLPASRRQGWGSEIVRGLVGWAVARGATSAFLQVEEANVPAVALYEGLGFRTLYSYSYRRPPT
jgi:ribosomal protein S18 acetylase RimI-like enzyme